jgi:hypothetical protein
MASAGASACEQCSYDLCKTETCACQADSDCKAGSNDFYTCLSGPAAGDGVHCGENFAGSAGPGAGKASDLGTCMLDKCLDRCQGRDAGPRH